jgi:hypothetical protein
VRTGAQISPDLCGSRRRRHAAVTTPIGGYARPGADWALVTECHAVLGQLALTLVGLLSVTGVIGKVIVA